jgi:hypothetical protein
MKQTTAGVTGFVLFCVLQRQMETNSASGERIFYKYILKMCWPCRNSMFTPQQPFSSQIVMEIKIRKFLNHTT